MSSSRDEFYLEYGAAMAEWAFVERELCTLFVFFTKIPAALATSIFYSVNSFDARAAIFESALSHATFDDNSKGFLEAAISKARNLSQFRNVLAHDLMVDNAATRDKIEHFLVHGRAQFQDDETKAKAMLNAVSIDDIKAARRHFTELGGAMLAYWSSPAVRNPALLERLHAQVVAIPNPRGTRPHFPTKK
jgi:hypothetical protein